LNDGVRENVVWDDIIRIDSHIKFMLEMWGLRYFQISTPIMQERIRNVEAVISLVGSKMTPVHETTVSKISDTDKPKSGRY
jgi:hypothetical protein